MNDQLQKLLALLDSVIESGKKATDRPWENLEEEIYPKGQLIIRNKIAECFNKNRPVKENINNAHAITLFANFSPLMAETLKITILRLNQIAHSGPEDDYCKQAEWARSTLTDILNKWKHLL